MPRVAYYFDDDIGAYAFAPHHPMKPHRIKMAHSLVLNAGLHQKMDVLTAKRASKEEMTKFHTDEYISHIASLNLDDPEMLASGRDKSGDNRFLAGDDCPGFEGLFEFCSISAGGSIAAARRINSGQADIAINWAGGLHHAKKREASGFCYVNDIVLSILELLRFHTRVLYIDIDIHHGDGVEEAFYTTDRVLTCSFHKFGDFFPGTGHVGDLGIGKGNGYAVNVPLKTGINDETYRSIFQPVINHIMAWYQPGAVVLQCGADSLAEDKLGSFNLSMNGHADCVRHVKSFGVPLILLGGGGYTIRNVARTWAYETSVCLGPSEEMNPAELPYNEYMEYFGPTFKLDVPSNNMENQNSREYLNNILAQVVDNLRNMPFAPSVQQRPLSRMPDTIEDSEDSDALDSAEPHATSASSSNNQCDPVPVDPPPVPQVPQPARVGRPSRIKPAISRISPRLTESSDTNGSGGTSKDGCEGHNSNSGERPKRTFFRNQAFDRSVQTITNTRKRKVYSAGQDSLSKGNVGQTESFSQSTSNTSSLDSPPNATDSSGPFRLPQLYTPGGINGQQVILNGGFDLLSQGCGYPDQWPDEMTGLIRPKEIVMSWDLNHCF